MLITTRILKVKPRAIGLNIVGCYELCPFAHPPLCVVGSCCAKFETGQTFSYVQRRVNVFPQCISIQSHHSAQTLEQVRTTWRNVLLEIRGYHRSATFQRTISLFALLDSNPVKVSHKNTVKTRLAKENSAIL